LPSKRKKKVAYLFGAGATHAELVALNPDLVPETEGLLISNVSPRVIKEASTDAKYIRGLETVSATSGQLKNIELLISLIENAKMSDWDDKTRRLKELVQADIENILTPYKRGRFYLHRALFELHQRRATKEVEEIVGFISLNYDDVLDRAYNESIGAPNYSFALDDDSASIPLLKLHGSFNWHNARIRGQRRRIEIIPLGSAKTYLHAPYVFIWTRALEVLINCDALRIIGCSLSPNDVHLIDLLFKAHLERREPFDIEVIDFEETGESIRNNYGFFPQIRTLSKIENILIPDTRTTNPFKHWLRYKSLDMLGRASVRRLSYLRRVLN